MAKIFGQLESAQAENLAANPASTATGRIIFDTVLNVLKVYANSAWRTLVDTNSSQVLTEKDIDGGTASNTSRFTIPKDTKANLDLLTRKEGTLVYATDEDKIYVDDGSVLVAAGAGSGTIRVTQNSHGFAIGDVLYHTGTLYAKAKADLASTAEVVGIVSAVTTNTFDLTTSGFITGLSGLTAGSVYYLSSATAGLLTTAEPTTIGQVSKPVFIANSTTGGFVVNMRGSVVGGVNARTLITLANNASTTVQNVSAYSAGRLEGWVEIAATTPLRFFISMEFAKLGVNTDYGIAFQTSGDTPPTGFAVAISTGGVISITLPSLAGYTSASINYALNAPAVGATFPLSILSSQVLGLTLGAPASGAIGELIQSVGASVALTGGNDTYSDLLSRSLTPGVWKISFQGIMAANGATTWKETSLALSTATGSSTQDIVLGISRQYHIQSANHGTGDFVPLSGSCRATVTATQITLHNTTDSGGTARTGTTIYLKAKADNVAGGAQVVHCSLTCERIA